MAYVRTFACARVYVCVGPGETIMEKDETSKMKSTEEGQWVPLVEEVSPTGFCERYVEPLHRACRL